MTQNSSIYDIANWTQDPILHQAVDFNPKVLSSLDSINLAAKRFINTAVYVSNATELTNEQLIQFETIKNTSVSTIANYSLYIEGQKKPTYRKNTKNFLFINYCVYAINSFISYKSYQFFKKGYKKLLSNSIKINLLFLVLNSITFYINKQQKKINSSIFTAKNEVHNQYIDTIITRSRQLNDIILPTSIYELQANPISYE